jgi:glycosyltransferase family protein
MSLFSNSKLRYGKPFKMFRKLAKHLLSLAYPVAIKLFPLPKVLSIDETIDKIIKEKVSICRFGDGELLYIVDQLNLPFQTQLPRLRNELIKILSTNHQNIIIGLPNAYAGLENFNDRAKLTWRSQITWIYPRLKKYLLNNATYYNGGISRLYIDFEDTSKCQYYFERMMSIWKDRDVVLIEGEKSRLGVGNNLFSQTKSIQRIICPAQNAFDKFDKIYRTALEQSKEKLILVAMGPTAKVLVFNLSLAGFQALDIGNIDIEYEWFLMKVKRKVKVIGKYTSEAAGGRVVDDIFDVNYENQIIIKII